MNRESRSYSAWGMLLLAGLAFCLVMPGQAFSATIVIDDMSVAQGNSSVPALNDCTALGPPLTDATTGPSATMIGGNRVLEITHTVGEGPCTKAYVDGGTPRLWTVVNDTNSTGWGRIVWSGASTIGAYSLPLLDLTYLTYFNVVFVTADHQATFTLQVFSDATHGSQATIISFPTGGGNANNTPVLPGAFSAIPSLAAADFSQIKEIRILFSEFLEIDTGLRGVSAVTDAPPDVYCDYKTMNGQQSLVVTGDGPYNLTVAFGVTNGGGVPSKIVVEDDMPAGMTYVGPTTCSGGFVLGEPDQLLQKLTWTSTDSLAAKASLTCSFPAQLASLAADEIKYDVIRAREINGTFGPEECQASISRYVKPPGVPSMNEWGVMLTVAILAAAGLYLARRKSKA